MGLCLFLSGLASAPGRGGKRLCVHLTLLFVDINHAVRVKQLILSLNLVLHGDNDFFLSQKKKVC